jgi:hypothetical protein
VNILDARELLERAAASVTPAEVDPAARMLTLGRRSVRRRRIWAAAGSVAAVVAAVVALPLVMAVQDRPDTAASREKVVSFGGLSVVVPKGWRTSRVANVDLCTAAPRTIYLAAQWHNSSPRALPPGSPLYKCTSEGQPWMAVVSSGVSKYLNPERLMIEDGRLLQVQQQTEPSVWTYRVFNEDPMATSVLISGDEAGGEQLLKRVTWPAGPPAPPSGGLALPEHITSAVTEDAGPMVSASDAKTLTRIRTELAELRDPVPAGEECTLQKPGRVGIGLGDVIVVLGDKTCPQAISTGGGRVRAPAGLGKELLGLIVASERAAAERHKKN